VQSSTNILIIEDNPDDYEACVCALKNDNKLANKIIWCSTGDEGLDYLYGRGVHAEEHPVRPCLIMLDLNLPGTDGREVLTQLKSDEHLSKIPVVVMTSSRDADDIDACYAAGANSYVVKPVDLDGFIKAITRLREYWFEISVLPEVK